MKKYHRERWAHKVIYQTNKNLENWILCLLSHWSQEEVHSVFNLSPACSFILMARTSMKREEEFSFAAISLKEKKMWSCVLELWDLLAWLTSRMTKSTASFLGHKQLNYCTFRRPFFLLRLCTRLHFQLQIVLSLRKKEFNEWKWAYRRRSYRKLEKRKRKNDLILLVV